MDIALSVEDQVGDRRARIMRLPDGRRIGYAEFGDAKGLPVLAIHGTPGSRYMFALTDQAARERGLRIIAPERPGYGLSDYRRRDALAQTAEDVNALADGLGLDRFALIGVSGGGPHAMAAAASIPDRVALLALISPVGPIADCHRRIRYVGIPSARLHPRGQIEVGLRLLLLVAQELDQVGARPRACRIDAAGHAFRPAHSHDR
jgi:pimeloyl-ACP methyl ester carboxylesterase